MLYVPDMLEPAKCRIARVEFQLLDLPDALSKMTGKNPDGRIGPLFSTEDDVAVSKIPSARIENNTFMPYFKDFCTLKYRYSFGVQNYGRFALVRDTYLIYEEVERLNVEMLELRRNVSLILAKKYMSSWQQEYIRRFNPRIKFGLFLLPKIFVEETGFRKQLNRMFKNEIRKGEMDIDWLLKAVDIKPGAHRQVHLDPKRELICEYLLEHTDF